MENNQTNIEQAEAVANIVQIGVNGIAGHYGGNIGKAFSNFLTGNAAALTSIGDLVNKINNGTATSKDISDALQDMASIVAGFGVITGYANPWVFSALFTVGVIKGTADYIDANPDLAQEMKGILDNPSNLKEWVDIWNYFDQKFTITDTLTDLWEEFDGGSGFDTYIAHNGDFISDDDGLGAVYLGIEHLDGGVKETIKHIEVTTTNFTKTFIYCECETVTKWSDVETDEWIEEEEFYVDKATGTKYILNGSSLSVISSSGSITINNFSDGDLGINLSETESIDKKEITKEVFLEEDFCSPLVLDLNGNGINSTRLNESTVYFDMDGDGLCYVAQNNTHFKSTRKVA